HSTATYTSISSDYVEPSDVGSSGVMVYEYNGLPMYPPSPDCVPGPEHPPSPDYLRKDAANALLMSHTLLNHLQADRELRRRRSPPETMDDRARRMRLPANISTIDQRNYLSGTHTILPIHYLHSSPLCFYLKLTVERMPPETCPDREIGCGITDVLEDPDEIAKKIPATSVAELGQRMTDFVTITLWRVRPELTCEALGTVFWDAQVDTNVLEHVTLTEADDDSHNSGTGSRSTERTTHECTYTDFLKCQPMNFKDIGQDAAHSMPWNTLMKMMTAKYCPQNEIKKFEMEIWELKVKGQKATCDECGAQEHFKRECPKLKNNNRGNQGGNGNALAKKYMLKGCHVFLAHVTTKKTEDKSEGKQLEDVLIVRDFPKVFLEDLLGLPPTRQVEFQIDLMPGVAPVARAPYRLSPSEMKELSDQLQEPFRQKAS
ncbi:hypothetical protein Tco_0940376, partial [Tanacetum coccineum]